MLWGEPGRRWVGGLVLDHRVVRRYKAKEQFFSDFRDTTSDERGENGRAWCDPRVSRSRAIRQGQARLRTGRSWGEVGG